MQNSIPPSRLTRRQIIGIGAAVFGALSAVAVFVFPPPAELLAARPLLVAFALFNVAMGLDAALGGRSNRN